ncbi:hypothetical protein BO78DRAFT_152914 [Aspergillus sclerotiicarbonarius CBS 121057]|uniref:Uncharacterized protein n=1 Tax=Aspergillus sclerotiicarbonarius (strain CBS 121057 / IBT 28362) TaxID=1448318 RepID=A0A319E772_ASPSB|nr:hypothetical protein BO78DRAFT_152914 [Aspergillus sclerotiicarbonarius CBS 121057]
MNHRLECGYWLFGYGLVEFMGGGSSWSQRVRGFGIGKKAQRTHKSGFLEFVSIHVAMLVVEASVKLFTGRNHLKKKTSPNSAIGL